MSELAFHIEEIGDLSCLVWLHTSNGPSVAEWDEACAQVLQLAQRRNGDLSSLRAIVLSDGGGPSSRQRAQLFREIYQGYKVQTAAFSVALANPLVRGLATAASWLNPGIKLFQPSAWNEGLKYLSFEQHSRHIAETIALVARGLPRVKTVDAILQEARVAA